MVVKELQQIYVELECKQKRINSLESKIDKLYLDILELGNRIDESKRIQRIYFEKMNLLNILGETRSYICFSPFPLYLFFVELKTPCGICSAKYWDWLLSYISSTTDLSRSGKFLMASFVLRLSYTPTPKSIIEKHTVSSLSTNETNHGIFELLSTVAWLLVFEKISTSIGFSTVRPVSTPDADAKSMISFVYALLMTLDVRDMK